jgi:hypothetical protein
MPLLLPDSRFVIRDPISYLFPSVQCQASIPTPAPFTLQLFHPFHPSVKREPCILLKE